MGLPRTLKNFNLSQDGGAWVGEVKQVTLPKLQRKLEEYRGAGMDMGVKLDMGADAMDLEFTAGGPLRQVIAAYGGTLGGTMLRFSGAYQQDDTGAVTAVSVIVRGRYEEIDLGEAEPGKAADFKGKLSLSYYRLEWDGLVLVEADPLNMLLMVDGVDILAAQRAAISI